MRWVLRVVKARAPARLLPGDALAVDVAGTVGRDPNSTIVVDDPRVSRVQLAVTPMERGVELIPRGASPVYVERELLVGPRTLGPGEHVQLGGVLLRLEPSVDPTAHPTGPMSLSPGQDLAPPAPSPQRAPALLHLDLDQRRVWLGGVEVALQPGPLQVLERLAAEPGVWVPAERIAAAVWGEQLGPRQVPYLSKYVSTVRAGLRTALEGDAALAARLAEAAREVGEPAAPAPLEDLLRLVVRARKKVGFRLSLPPGAVSRTRA